MTTEAPQAPTGPQIDAEALFTYRPCICCDCCTGYCPDSETTGPRWRGPFMALSVDGVEYAGDRWFVLRRDLLDGFPSGEGDGVPPIVEVSTLPAWALVPTAKPVDSPARQSADLLDRWDRAGLTAHLHAAAPGIVHLYLGDQHAGWGTVANGNGGIERDELALVRRIARSAYTDLNRAATALRIAHGEPDLT